MLRRSLRLRRRSPDVIASVVEIAAHGPLPIGRKPEFVHFLVSSCGEDSRNQQDLIKRGF